MMLPLPDRKAMVRLLTTPARTESVTLFLYAPPGPTHVPTCSDRPTKVAPCCAKVYDPVSSQTPWFDKSAMCSIQSHTPLMLGIGPGATTSIAATPRFPSAVAETVAAPGPVAVTKPVADTVAMLASLVPHAITRSVSGAPEGPHNAATSWTVPPMSRVVRDGATLTLSTETGGGLVAASPQPCATTSVAAASAMVKRVMRAMVHLPVAAIRLAERSHHCGAVSPRYFPGC